MSKNITVTYSMSDFRVDMQGYALDVEVTAATEVTDKIFVFQTAPEGLAEGKDVFQCVASPVQLEELPADDPDLDNDMPYYRKEKVTLHFSHPDILVMYKNLISNDIKQLMDSLEAMASFTTQETTTY